MTIIVTNAMKGTGLVIAVHELLIRGQLRPVVAATAAFMMAGGRFSEHAVLAILDRLLGPRPIPPPVEVEKPPSGS